MGRIEKTLAEISAVARHDLTRAAGDAVLFLEKRSPALCEVDGSSSALSNACYAAVNDLAQLIASEPVDIASRRKWLDRRFSAVKQDEQLGGRD